VKQYRVYANYGERSVADHFASDHMDIQNNFILFYLEGDLIYAYSSHNLVSIQVVG
jgi:hypothetical protein